MYTDKNYGEFIGRLKLLVFKRPELIKTVLANIFTMRLIGNKTHGDLAEIAIAEFINQYMYDFRSVHVGKDLYRAKSREEDITITNEITRAEFPVSLKAYGDGPLQLSTDKESLMFARLKTEGEKITGKNRIHKILSDAAFVSFRGANILPLIYDEPNRRCGIFVFDHQRAATDTARIIMEKSGERRIYPVYRFFNAADEYICEVRYGGVNANALQRGLWTNTKKGRRYFDSITGGWINYADNKILVKLFSCALVSSASGHTQALARLKKDIARLKEQSEMRQ